jgi:hypothetical protein
VCYLPGWTCTRFDEATFPAGSTGVVSYAGLEVRSRGEMVVTGGVLVIGPPPPHVRPLPLDLVTRLLDDEGSATELGPEGAVLLVDGLDRATAEPIPAVGDLLLVPADAGAADPWSRSRGSGVTSASTLKDLLGNWRSLPAPRVHGRLGLLLLSSVTIVTPVPATRVRVGLDGDATVIAFAGATEVARGNGTAGSTVSLVADPSGPAHIGWCDRVTVLAPAEVRITQFCTDAGPFGWARYEQWRWSRGVQRAVESMYQPSPVLRPGAYRLQAHTATVITGAAPEERFETARASFTVGPPPGFPAAGAPSGLAGPVYPYGGPLTDLDTYIAGTVPAAGVRPWYRRLDTGVVFDEDYVTRMYLQTGRELRVVVHDAGGRMARGPTPHYWGTTDIDLDAWTWEWVRTLNGDGTDVCATVNLDRVTRPDALLAGGGEPLGSALLHRCELVAASSEATTAVHGFEFVTSRFTDLAQHLATFDGRARRRPASTTVAVDVPALARLWAATLDTFASRVEEARQASVAARTGTATAIAIDVGRTAAHMLTTRRTTLRADQAAAFEQHWATWLGGRPSAQLPEDLLVTAVHLPGASGGDVLVIESPEPVDWDRVSVTAAMSVVPPLELATSVPTTDFGRPDAGFSVEDGGLQWDAGVELWIRDGAVRARRDDEDLDVTLRTGVATQVAVTLDVPASSSATITTEPPRSSGDLTVAPPQGGGRLTVAVPASVADPILSVAITGRAVGVVSCSVTRRFTPRLPTGSLRVADVVLPTSVAPTGHHVTLVAMAPVPTLAGWTLEWIDPLAPAEPVLYAQLPAIGLRDGQRLRLFPGLTAAPVLDDALVSAGGPGEDPPAHGAIMRLADPDGRIVHETAVVGATTSGPQRVVPIPDAEGTRALLLPTGSLPTFAEGWWTLTFTSQADAGPDLPRWSVAGRPAEQTCSLRFGIPK